MLTRSIQLRADTIDGARRTVNAVVATENPVEVSDYASRSILPEILLIDGCELNGQYPLLTDHQRSVPTTIGSARDFRREGNGLMATLAFASGVPAADEAWTLVSQKHLRDISVGYQVRESTMIQPGRSANIKGRTFTATDQPLRVVTAWRLKECSLVPIGADPAAQIRSLPSISFSDLKGTKPVTTTLDVLGGQVRSMPFSHFLAVGMKKRGEAIPENDMDVCRAALSSVGGVADLAGVVTSQIIGEFCAAPDTTAGWVRVVDLPNFLLSEIAAVTTAPRLGKVARGDVAPTVGFAVGSQGWRLARFGCNFAIDEQDLVDGQAIGVYAIALEEIGRAARRLIPDLVYATLLGNANMADGTPIFDSTRGNHGTAGLVDTTLDAGLAAVGNQVAEDESGDAVHRGLSAGYLTVPPDLVGRASRLVFNMGGNLAVRGESRLGPAGVVDPRYDTIVEGSATNWLLSCPSDQAAGVVIGALGGRVEPIVRHYSLTNGEYGLGFDVKMDLACTVVDPATMYFSTGAGS